MSRQLTEPGPVASWSTLAVTPNPTPLHRSEEVDPAQLRPVPYLAVPAGYGQATAAAGSDGSAASSPTPDEGCGCG